MALKILIDTCVWLDLAKDYRQQPVINALEDLVDSGELELLVPQVLLDEFARTRTGWRSTPLAACNLILVWYGRP
jgi:hypothetical protein